MSSPGRSLRWLVIGDWLVVGCWWLVSGWHVETHVLDVAGFVEAYQTLGKGFDLVLRKNEAMIGGLPGNSFVFVKFEEGGGVLEVATLALGAVGLDLAQLVEAFLELAREARAVQSKRGQLRD
jgi:hypothetical protein